MKQLIEDYKRRLKSVTKMLAEFKSTGSINDIQKDARLNAKASEFRTIIAELEKCSAVPEFIKNIDWKLLKQQNAALTLMINSMGESEDDRNALEGIQSLIDSLRDYAVDELGIPEMQVFDLEVEEEREFNVLTGLKDGKGNELKEGDIRD